MSTKREVREFLVSRRANVTPEQAGLVRIDELQRVAGLRRREVAELAGVSLNDYSRLEQGYVRDASEGVLEAVAEALNLSEVDREYLFELARTAPARSTTTQPSPTPLRSRARQGPVHPPLALRPRTSTATNAGPQNDGHAAL